MNKNLRRLIMILAFFQAAVATVAFAQTDEPVSTNGATPSSYEENLRRWRSMSEEEREAIRQKVNAIEPEQREVIRENARKFKELPREEQDRVRGNFRRFRELPADRRESLREEGRRFQGLPPERRAELRRGARDHRNDMRDRNRGPGNMREAPHDRKPGMDKGNANAPSRQKGGPGGGRRK